MRHPNPEEWTDYVRGVFSAERGQILGRHLSGGCQKCERQVDALQAVQQMAEANARFEPPTRAIRAAENVFRVQELLRRSNRPSFDLRPSFDSFQAQPAAGVRSSTSHGRHLVFKSPRLLVDLQLAGTEAGEPVRIRGQILDGDSNPISDVPTFLLDGGRIHSQDLSGSIGDFRLLGEVAGAPRLCLLLGDDLVDMQLPRLCERARTH